MDIDLLSKMVKELILDNDRVVLPGLGAFVAEIVPSIFSDKGYTINPPYRRMSFRAKPDEGMELAELYAEANRVDLAVADRIIRDFVGELKSTLHSRKAVTFPGLGRLRATKENNIFFIADEDLDIYPAGFGLEPVSLKTHQETPEEVAAAVVDLKSMLMNNEEAVIEVLPEMESLSEHDADVLPEMEEEPQDTPKDKLTVKPEAATQKSEETVIGEVLPAKKKKNVGKTLLCVLGIIFAIAVFLLAVLAILGRTCPELTDRLLYSQEELKILNYIL